MPQHENIVLNAVETYPAHSFDVYVLFTCLKRPSLVYFDFVGTLYKQAHGTMYMDILTLLDTALNEVKD